MTPLNFEKLCTDLQNVARIIPLKWGNIQNDETDGKLRIFDIKTFEDLEEKLASFPERDQQYFRRRWFLYNCATCDELIFCQNPNVNKNPSQRDKAYDIEFNNNLLLRFDVKGTVIPKQFRNEIDDVLINPQKLIDFYYQNQSTGVRAAIQNRLFLVHHSYKDPSREMYLRCIWKHKKEFYGEIAGQITANRPFYKYEGRLVLLVFIFEQENGTISYQLI